MSQIQDISQQLQNLAFPYLLIINELTHSLALTDPDTKEDTFYLYFPDYIKVSNAYPGGKDGERYSIIDESNVRYILDHAEVIEAIKKTKETASLYYQEQRIRDIIEFVCPKPKYWRTADLALHNLGKTKGPFQAIDIKVLPYQKKATLFSMLASTKLAIKLSSFLLPSYPKTCELLKNGKILNVDDLKIALNCEI